MTLDERIEKDLKELYNDGKGINKLIEDFGKCDLSTLKADFQNCKISAAEDLSLRLFGVPTAFSIHGLPGYFTGDRGAKTVMVMLNPGQDVAGKDNPVTTIETLSKLGIKTDSVDEFVNSYKNGNRAFGTHDRRERENKTKGTNNTKKTKKVYPDNFDLKQAAFLKEWPKDCGVDISDSFPPEELELVPYASRKFDGIDSSKYKYLFPYIKTLFDEIFSENYKGKEPRYVIFCSAFFEDLFKVYNEEDDAKYPGWIDIKKETIHNPEILDKNVSCSLIEIHRYGKKDDKQNGPSIKAIIAHTFPNQALPNAYDRMRKYGKYCWDLYEKYLKPNEI